MDSSYGMEVFSDILLYSGMVFLFYLLVRHTFAI